MHLNPKGKDKKDEEKAKGRIGQNGNGNLDLPGEGRPSEVV